MRLYPFIQIHKSCPFLPLYPGPSIPLPCPLLARHPHAQIRRHCSVIRPDRSVMFSACKKREWIWATQIKLKNWNKWNGLILPIETSLVGLRWLYCLTIIGCNFVFNDLLHVASDIDIKQWTLVYLSIHAHLMTSRWCHQVLGEILFFFFYNSLFLKKWNHLSNFASSTNMII